MNPLLTDRAQLLAQLDHAQEFDLAIIGGGATGLGVAVDAAVRGLKVVLLEAHDFAKGTSSRSTKLVHGGVRYLAQGHLPLVWEALRERQHLLSNAAHLVQPMPFVMPAYRRRDQWLYGLGLKLYDLLAGPARLGPTRLLGHADTLLALPGVRVTNLVGGVEYWDAQFDDARLALALARTAASHGALMLNHMPVTGLLTEYPSGRLKGLTCQDAETGQERHLKARCVVNATGVWVDQIEAMLHAPSGQLSGAKLPRAVRPSQGAHLVVDASFWPGSSALLVPHTQDGRVLFAVPWQGKVLLGTTDTPKSQVDWEPKALESEIDQILQEAAKYLVKPPQRSDVTSVWAGLRPLARPDQTSKDQDATQNVSREHAVTVASNGLVSVTGGKWTTYRAMAADVMQSIRKAQLISLTTEDVTVDTKLWGAPPLAAAKAMQNNGTLLSPYGTDAELLASLPGADLGLGALQNHHLSEAMVRFAARYEYARTVEDVLARRNRLLFLDASAALAVAPQVAAILSAETGVSPQLEAFEALAKSYQMPSKIPSTQISLGF
jgi:glycerol-3-phosphate dehydrogenase